MRDSSVGQASMSTSYMVSGLEGVTDGAQLGQVSNKIEQGLEAKTPANLVADVTSSSAETEENSIEDRIANVTRSFSLLSFFPHATLLLRKDLLLVAANTRGQRAIESHQVSLDTRKHLCFHCIKDEEVVRNLVESIFSNGADGKEGASLDKPKSRRVILRCPDSLFRVFSFSRVPNDDSLVLLCIQNEFTLNENKVRSLQNAFGLSQSETQVLRMMVCGLKPKQIAYEMRLSLNTVRSHLRTLYAKMQVRDYTEALFQAVKLLM